MRVLIAGAGPAGLALYRLLSADGHHVRLVERAARFDHIGYGIGLWGSAWRALERIGAADAAWQSAVPVDTWRIRDAEGTLLAKAGPTTQRQLPPFAVIHRADLHTALLADVPHRDLTMNTTITEVRKHEREVHVRLSDESTQHCDALIGADGVHSDTRRLVFGTSQHDIGTAAWAFRIPQDVDLPDGFTELWGRDGKAMLIVSTGSTRLAPSTCPCLRTRPSTTRWPT